MNGLEQLDGPSVAVGIFVGAVVVLLWGGVLFAWDSLLAWLARGDAHLQVLVDDALAVNDEPAGRVAR